MVSLSTGAWQVATRKAVIDVLLHSHSLRGQFHEADVIVKILCWKCDVNIDKNMLLNAFKCSDDVFSIQLSDIGVANAGNDVLYVYKNFQIADGTRITAIGVFKSVEAAKQIDIADQKQRDGILQNIMDVHLDATLEERLENALAAEAKKRAKQEEKSKAKDRAAATVRPLSPPESSSSSSSKENQPPQKKMRQGHAIIPTPESTSNQNDNNDITTTSTRSSHETVEIRIAMDGRSDKLVAVEVGSTLYKMLLEQYNLELEDEEKEEDNNDDGNEENELETTGESNAECKREYQTTFREVTVGKHTIQNVPSCCEVVNKNVLSRLKENSACIDKLRLLFKTTKVKTDDPEKERQRCSFSDVSKLFLAAASLQNSGGSDNGTVTLIAATVTVLLDEMGITDISAGNIGKVCPSETLIADYELHLAVNCVLLGCDQINKTESKVICLTTDKGNRKNMSHNAKEAHFASKDPTTGARTISHIVLDVDECGGTSQETAEAIEWSIRPYKIVIPDLTVQGITGDSGGGGSVQTIFEPLQQLNVIHEHGKPIRCDMHAMAKPLENASEFSMGTQGLGKNTIFQLGYAAASMFRNINKQGGASLVDTYMKLVREKLENCQEWKDEADQICKQAYDNYIDNVASEEEDDDDDEVSGFRNLQLPVFSRWTSVLKGLVWMRDNYVVIYFTAVAIIQKDGSNSAMSKTAADIIALMSMRADAGGGAESEDEPLVEEGGLRPGETPILLAQTHFLCGFGEAFYTPYFKMAMQADQTFGTDSHGHLSRHLVERCYVMMKELRDMMHDRKWQTMPEFKPYMDSREGLPCLGDVTLAGREFMDAVADAFFEQFLVSAVKHIETQWTSDKLLPYLIGGNPVLCRELLRWLQACENGDLEADTFRFRNGEVDLENLKEYGLAHTVNIGEAMRYLTADSSPVDILKDPLVAKHKDLLFKSLEAEDTVDFFDEDTWDGEDYEPILDHIHEYIVPHASHQQRVECLIQMINIMARTNVKGTRRTARLIAWGVLIHTYNRLSVDEKQKERATISEKKKVKRVKGAERQAGLLPHLHERILASIELKKALPDGVYDQIHQHYKKGVKTKKEEANKKKKEEMVAALEKRRKINKSQRNAKPHIPIIIGGGVEFRWFADVRGNVELLRLEIASRGIVEEYEGGEKVTLQLNEEPLASMTQQDMKECIKRDELAKMGRDDNVKEGKSVGDINSFVPQSQEVKDKIPEFLEWKTSRNN
jgi:hypothetical protein